MNTDSSDSREQATKESPNKPKENFVENVLDDIMGEDLNFEDFDDDVDHQNDKTRNTNTQKRKIQEEKITQKETEQTKPISNSFAQDKENSNQLRSLTSLDNDRGIKSKDTQVITTMVTKDKEAPENYKEEKEKQNQKVVDKQSLRSMISSKERPARYFIIKSNNFEHLEISMQKSIWSTQPHNEQKLNEAFEVLALA